MTAREFELYRIQVAKTWPASNYREAVIASANAKLLTLGGK